MRAIRGLQRLLGIWTRKKRAGAAQGGRALIAGWRMVILQQMAYAGFHGLGAGARIEDEGMKDMDDAAALIQRMGQEAQAAAAALREASAERKHAALIGAAEAVRLGVPAILEANARDLEFGRDKGLSDAMMDRLRLDEDRIRAIEDGLRAVAEQPDPIGSVIAEWDRPNGLHIQRVRTPIGVIGVIYESRPNVTADAGALALKSGNAVILRGGSESLHSSRAIYDCMVAGLRSAGLPETAI